MGLTCVGIAERYTLMGGVIDPSSGGVEKGVQKGGQKGGFWDPPRGGPGTRTAGGPGGRKSPPRKSRFFGGGAKSNSRTNICPDWESY